MITLAWCVETAREAGVNRILLPDSIAAEEIQQLTADLHLEAVQLGGYYLLRME